MAGEINSPNMSMPIPAVGITAGPQFATDVNNSLTIVDSHNHTAGSGLQVPSSGLNISTDLTFQNNNATNLRSARLTNNNAILSLPADLRCLYAVGADLYFNDGNGTNIRITQSGAIAGAPGTITGLASPASAVYTALASTFTWQSDVNTPANMDAGAVILRNLTANSKGLTLNPPTAMGADFALTLPPLPVSTKIMTLNASGAMVGNYDVDNSTIQISSNTLKVPTSGITTTQIADSNVTTIKIADLNVTNAKLSSTAVTPDKMNESSFPFGQIAGGVGSISGNTNILAGTFNTQTNMRTRVDYMVIIQGYNGSTNSIQLKVGGGVARLHTLPTTSSDWITLTGYYIFQAGSPTALIEIFNGGANSTFVNNSYIDVSVSL